MGHFCVNELPAILPCWIINAIPEVDASITQQAEKIGVMDTHHESGSTAGISRPRSWRRG